MASKNLPATLEVRTNKEKIGDDTQERAENEHELSRWKASGRLLALMLQLKVSKKLFVAAVH